MEEREVKAGEIVYREGDPPDAVYVIQSGEIEVVRQANGMAVTLGRLGPGNIFGEMGVLRDKPRSTTTRARGPTRLVVLPKAEFLAAFGQGSPLALPLLRMLCERLNRADQGLLASQIADEGVALAEVAEVTLRPGSHLVETQIGTDGLAIRRFPFRVGRRLLPGEPGKKTPDDLTLVAGDDHHMSPQHFAIDTEEGRLVVRDLDSHLGTIVNGRRIASFEERVWAGLRFGENEVRAGGADTPFRFRIIVTPL